MNYLTTNEIRQIWLDFFKDKGHKVEDSASLVPNNDPTLLWINAGVAPLKKYFDGRVIPANPRIVNAQKCIRTNDIDNVGKTARHHTFFEMLGNFSIGDYFRDEIIEWAAELLFDEKYYGYDQDKIYITVYPDDVDTYNAWLDVGIDRSHLILCEHNFWEIGEGPCGPDTEIFYDRGDAYGKADLSLIEHDIENDRYIEIWNIVLSQFNAKPGLSRDQYPELPSKNIDTGMGLERMACVIQGVPTNFETDTFQTIMNGIARYASEPYTGQMSYKVIADHVRTVTFAVSDGAVLSNEGRGYVLRRLLRRAVKHGKALGIHTPFLHMLVDDVIAAMGAFYPYLNDTKEIVKQVIRLEEIKFFETLAQGEKILDDMMTNNAKKMLSGEDAFTLYDTYGFPLELTIEMAEEHGFTVDQDGFHQAMNAQKERARSARKSVVSMNAQNEAFLSFKAQDTFTGYDTMYEQTTVLKAFDEGVVLTKTPFYAESGGQVADGGVLRKDGEEFPVEDVQKLPNGQFLHVLGTHSLHDGDTVEAMVDETQRTQTMHNHSATHLLFAALREIVGDHVSQQGSNVSAYGMRFDFNNFTILSDEVLLAVEQRVNEKIQAKADVDIQERTIEEAKAMGAIAEFGEKYDSTVRVIDMGYTIDLCGGTHVHNLGDIQRFAIASIDNKGSGIYRITGHASDSIENIRDQLKGFNDEIDKLMNKANHIVQEAKEKGIELSFSFAPNHKILGSYQDIINKRLEFQAVTDQVKELDKAYQAKAKEQAMANLDQYLDQRIGNTLVVKTENIDAKSLRPLADKLMDHLPGGIVFIANVTDDKVTFIVKSQSKAYHAGQIAKEAAVICGGNGGGRPDMAQAGGKDITKVDEALAQVKTLIS